MFTVDVHCHMFSEEVEQLVAERPEKLGERASLEKVQGLPSARFNDAVMLPRANRKMQSLDERLSDMDSMGVDVQIVSPSPTQYYYWADEDLARELVHLQNHRLAEQCTRHPDRLRCMANVALQHPQLAAEQLTYAIRELGMVGVEVSSLVNGRELTDSSLLPFWEAAAALDCVVFLHPLGTSLGERVNSHYLSNIIGQPLETTIALSKLILDGTWDRHPALKLVAAHGGGYLGAYAGRLDHGWHVRPEARTCAQPPSEYMRRIWHDTVVYDPRILRHLIETHGASQLLLGTDYPFDMGMEDVHANISAIPGVTDDERRALLGRNALRLFDLERVFELESGTTAPTEQ
jgi:aminocarboxymuconate-semialdehyde decarboxylase